MSDSSNAPINDFSTLIDRLGVEQTARACRTNEGHVRAMKTRRSISPDYWPPIITLAARRRLPGVDWSFLSALRRKRFRKRGRRVESPTRAKSRVAHVCG
jgi:hypothetical protein